MQIIFIIIVLGGLLSCYDNNLDRQLGDLVKLHQISSTPVEDESQQLRDIYSDQAQLGKLLFFSKNLSGNQNVACASCHHPLLGGDDDLSLSIGVDPVRENILGEGRKNRQGRAMVPRNAPTTFNSSLWKKSMFHDGRVERLNAFKNLPPQISTPDEKYGDIDPLALSLVQAQAGFPVVSEHEMRSSYMQTSSNESLRKALVKNLVNSVIRKNKSRPGEKSWRELFLKVYPADIDKPLQELMSFDRIRFLLGEYEKSQIFIDTPWRDYLLGKSSALTSSEKRGAILFFTEVKNDGGGCVSCHGGSFFTDEGFHVVAFPHIGEGVDIKGDDTGRFLRTGIYDDRYAFRTPSLINVKLTAPYGHNGVFANLRQTIRYHINPEKQLKSFDFSFSYLKQNGINTTKSKEFSKKSLKQFERFKQGGGVSLGSFDFTNSQVNDLVSFLEALTDRCIEKPACLKPWLPNESDPRPDDSIIYFYK
ncbi:cytochrome-c peroxidase [Pelagibaculum spongiae]|uniref:Cytochrome-c peroxidase n=1 Tax=Pelagibaculum spongiae TaxID=2080658 RepID=A0A2V1GR27_9GAMM|nr:cytochrome c peroxidase [Pelagibaculum spongiae]PVZ66759.1 cytochrome-c peroxidase [Pelagibaculum spongiae]